MALVYMVITTQLQVMDVLYMADTIMYLEVGAQSKVTTQRVWQWLFN
jgi:hypothetical protein